MRRILAAILLALVAAAPAARSQGIASFFEDRMADAVRNGNVQEAREALLKGANPNSKANSEYYYLIEATRANHAGIIRLLLEHNADPATRDQLGNTALHWAAEGNKPEIARLLLGGRADINAQDRNGLTPLMKAVQANHPAVVELLLREKADIALTDFTGRSALDIAQRERRTQIANMLKAAQKK